MLHSHSTLFIQTVYSNKTASSLVEEILMSFSGYLAVKTDKIYFTCSFANNFQEFANLNAVNKRNIPNFRALVEYGKSQRFTVCDNGVIDNYWLSWYHICVLDYSLKLRTIRGNN